jgi:hypothetical protein
MRNVKVALISILYIGVILVACMYVGYVYIIVQPNEKRLRWVENVYSECVKTSSAGSLHPVYADIQNVIEGKHSSKKLKKYLDIFKDYSLNKKCDLEEDALCLQSFLYLARAFLARGNDKDIQSALNVLGLYKDEGGHNIYFDTVAMAIALSESKLRETRNVKFEAVLEGLRDASLNQNYYSVQHAKKTCDVLLDHIGAVYAKIGEFSSDIYIQTNIVND